MLQCEDLHQCNDISINGSDHNLSSFSFGNLHLCNVLSLSRWILFIGPRFWCLFLLLIVRLHYFVAPRSKMEREDMWFHIEDHWRQIELIFHGFVQSSTPSICIRCRNLPPSFMKVSITNGSWKRLNQKAISKEIVWDQTINCEYFVWILGLLYWTINRRSHLLWNKKIFWIRFVLKKRTKLYNRCTRFNLCNFQVLTLLPLFTLANFDNLFSFYTFDNNNPLGSQNFPDLNTFSIDLGTLFHLDTHYSNSHPLMIFVLDIWISLMIICLSTQITEWQGTAMY